MFILLLLIGISSIYGIYKLDKAASNIEGRYLTLSKLLSNPEEKITAPENPKFGKEMMEQALVIIDEQVKYNYTIVLLVVGITLIFGGIITVMLPKKITKPLLSLVHATRLVKKGDYSYRIQSVWDKGFGGTDEISELTMSFNEMLQNIEETNNKNLQLIEEANRFNEVLKEKIEEATRAIKEHHDELMKSERLATIGEFATKVAHEIKNPLAGIRVALEIMKDKFEDQEQKQTASEILREVDRLDRMIKDLFQLSSQKDLELSETDTNEIVERAINLVNPRAEAKGVTIERLTASYQFHLDSERIEQVLINLLINGIDSIEGRGGKINVETEFSNDCLYIKVSDNGSGIAMEDLEKIFEPFYSTKKRGTGLGLSISKRIIEAHKGELLVSSEKDVGSTFVIAIPKI